MLCRRVELFGFSSYFSHSLTSLSRDALTKGTALNTDFGILMLWTVPITCSVYGANYPQIPVCPFFFHEKRTVLLGDLHGLRTKSPNEPRTVVWLFQPFILEISISLIWNIGQVRHIKSNGVLYFWNRMDYHEYTSSDC